MESAIQVGTVGAPIASAAPALPAQPLRQPTNRLKILVIEKAATRMETYAKLHLACLCGKIVSTLCHVLRKVPVPCQASLSALGQAAGKSKADWFLRVNLVSSVRAQNDPMTCMRVLQTVG